MATRKKKVRKSRKRSCKRGFRKGTRSCKRKPGKKRKSKSKRKRKSKKRKRKKSYKFRNCVRPIQNPCSGNIDILTQEEILQKPPPPRNIWTPDIQLLENRIVETNAIRLRLNGQLMQLMRRNQLPQFQSGIQKEINDKQKQEVRNQIIYINQHLETYKRRLQRLQQTLPPEISEEELYRNALQEGKLKNIVQFQPDNTCTTLTNYVEYGLDRIKKGEPILHPLTKQPIWCMDGISFREFILRESKDVTIDLLNDGYIHQQDSQRGEKIIEILSNSNFISENPKYRYKLDIILTQKYIRHYFNYYWRQSGLDKNEFIKEFTPNMVDLNAKILYDYVKKAGKEEFDTLIQQKTEEESELRDKFNKSMKAVKEILSRAHNLYHQDPVNQPPYAPCQFPDPETNIFFDKEFLKYCQEENSFSKEKKGLVNANLQDVDLSSRIFDNTNLQGANLSGSNLSYTDMSSANLQGATLDNTNFTGANLSEIYSGFIKFNTPPTFDKEYKIQGGYIFGPKVNIIKYNPMYNWKDPAIFQNPIDLQYMNLRASSFTGCRFYSANFTGSNLSHCNFGLLEGDSVQNWDGTIQRQFYSMSFGASVLTDVDVTGSSFYQALMSDVSNMKGIKGQIANVDLFDDNNKHVGFSRASPGSLPRDWVCKYGYFIGPGANLEGQVLEVRRDYGDPPPLTHTELSELYLQTTNFKNSDVHECDFSGSNLSNCDFSGAEIGNCDMSSCNLSESIFTNTMPALEYHNIINVNFEDSYLDGCVFLHILFDDCDFNSSKLRNINYQNVLSTNTNKPLCIFERCQMSACVFVGSQLKNITFKECSLSQSNFSDTTLENVIFENCDVSRSLFTNCRMRNVIFERCNMDGVTNFPSNYISPDEFFYKIKNPL